MANYCDDCGNYEEVCSCQQEPDDYLPNSSPLKSFLDDDYFDEYDE